MDFSRTAQSTYQGRLFALDAIQGLRLIDLTREVFDVVVMNPPFGLATKDRFEQLKVIYPDAYVDLYACFLTRAIEMCNGWVGSISSRSLLIAKKLERLRANWILPRIERLLDLGWPVMDDATVQSAAYTINCTSAGPNQDFIAIDRKPYTNKAERLATITTTLDTSPDCYFANREVIKKIPQSKLLYNLPSSAMHLFLDADHLGDEVLLARLGMKTFNDFRFLRLRSEILPSNIGKGMPWVPIAKGGAYANFYSDLPLVVNWENDGQQICEVNRRINGQTAQARQASTHYYKPGGTYSYRSRDFGVRVLPAGFIISGKGVAILPLQDFSAEFCVGLMNARLFRTLINLQANAKQYDSGIVESCPFIPFSPDSLELIEQATKLAIRAIRKNSQRVEGDSLFVCPEIRNSFQEMVTRTDEMAKAVIEVTESSLSEIDRHVDSTYRVDSIDLQKIILAEKESEEDEVEESKDDGSDDEGESAAPAWSASEVAFRLVSYAVGCAMGRWDIRYAKGVRLFPDVCDPFESLPSPFPGMLIGENFEKETTYPLRLTESGVLSDDEGSCDDFTARVQEAITLIWGVNSDNLEQELISNLSADSLRQYFRRPSGFFAAHLGLYTKSKRKAPIYWPLSTTSGSFTLWLYYPSLTSQTLYTVINDFVEPKLKEVGDGVLTLRNKGVGRSRDDEKQFEILLALEMELVEMQGFLLNIAQHYHPFHDDGVQITAAPLWQLFRHKPWQKILRDTWTKLESGDYDWAKIAMCYWPERVREKCKTDKSLAIAHGLEALYVEPEVAPKKSRSRKKSEGDE